MITSSARVGRYSVLRRTGSDPELGQRRRTKNKLAQLLPTRLGKRSSATGIQAGRFPVQVGTDQEAAETFVVSAKLLQHPAFVNLLKMSAAEFGYGQSGVLRIPVRVMVFERVMEMIRVSKDPADVVDWDEDLNCLLAD
ncbi:Auxin-responsive protein SAUR72 [Linum grandiflorum]